VVPITPARTNDGSSPVAEQLWRQLYDELRRLAAAKLARESSGQTLQPTALVHEAWLRLGADQQHTWQNRAHFFSSAAEAMRRILIDRARSRQAARHGGGQQRLNLSAIDLAAAMDDDRILAVNDALEKLALAEPAKAQLVKLRYFSGLTLAEAGQVLGISEPTAKRWWAYARAWLLNEMNPPENSPP
jgi:RNA polymerase sigma factor (TIGR02999 family)